MPKTLLQYLVVAPDDISAKVLKRLLPFEPDGEHALMKHHLLVPGFYRLLNLFQLQYE
ncbi:MAG: hypothetical protein WA996_07505 [Candidatus Promineifilaceae bacterium]